jgi:hypothetical protein
MDMRDKARSDLYLAQLRTQSAPNTPGFGPKSPAFSQYVLSPRFPPSTYRSLGDIEEGASPFTPGGKGLVIPQSAFSPRQTGFKLQAPPAKANPATPATPKAGYKPPTAADLSPVTPSSSSSSSASASASASASGPALGPAVTVNEPAPMAEGEKKYEAVPIPGAYAGQAIKSPPPVQTTFNIPGRHS